MTKPGDPSEDRPTYYKGKMIPLGEYNRIMAGKQGATPSPIPHQLQGCRFILLQKDKKEPQGKWKEQRYEYNDPVLTKHIKANHNYGVRPTGGVCVIDCDNVLALYDDPFFTDVLMQTFFVKSGRDKDKETGEPRTGCHFYIRCPEFSQKKQVLTTTDGIEVGDIRGTDHASYVVGPGSIHPDTGNKYEVKNDVEIIDVALPDLETFIARYHTKPKAMVVPHFTSAGNSISDKLDLQVSAFLMPDEPRPREHQIEGIHPVHGSSTGSNLIIDPIANKWYCRRHGTGGGPLEALAVAVGIIQCQDVRSGCLHGHWAEIYDALKKRGYSKQLAEMEREKQTKACAPQVQTKPAPEVVTDKEPVITKPQDLPDSAGQGYALTDAGNSDRLINQYGVDIKHCQTLKSWYTWTGKIWDADVTNKMLDYATRVARSIMIECTYISDPDASRSCGKWGIVSQSLARRNAMIDGATYQVAVTPDVWDESEHLYNCPNGTLELDTMTFREHRREDLLTKCGGVDYDPAAKCPQWEEHIQMVLADDDDLIRGFQEVCGYSLLALNPEQVLFILYGNGRNGKNVTMDTISYIMGDYAKHIAAESLMIKRGEAPRSDLARLAGARMVTASEPAENAALAESVIKQMTGDSSMTVRALYANDFELKPGMKIWLATNYQPRIVGTDEGIWRRIWLLPFTYTIPKDKRKLGYETVLQREGSGILNWCLEGYMRWQKNGLEQPAAVKVATAQYRTEADTVAAWVAQRIAFDTGSQMSRRETRTSYEQWCEEAGEKPVGARKLAQELRARGLTDGAVIHGVKAWAGIRWKTIDEQEGAL